MDIQQILTENNCEQLNYKMRKAFSPVTAPVEITTNLEVVLIVLVNLTDKTANQKNLVCKDTCKTKLKSEKWWKNCLTAAQHQQSHNIKFPDSRATGTIRATPIGSLPNHLLSSSNLPSVHWHYARNSKYVNIASFLCSEFMLNGSVTKLAILLKDEKHPVWTLLRKLGCLVKYQKIAVKALNKLEYTIVDVNLVSNYLKQITLPASQGSYVTLSPITSQSVQTEVHQTLETLPLKTAIYHCDKASNIGSFIAKAGGRVRVIRTTPTLKFCKKVFPKSRQWLTKERYQALGLFINKDDWLTTHNTRARINSQVRFHLVGMLNAWKQDVRNSETLSPEELAQGFNYSLSQTRYAHRFAYLPKLTQYFEKIFSTFNGSITDEPIKQQEPHSETFLSIRGIEVYHANAENSGYSVGLPSMMGIFGFLHAFERYVREDVPDFAVQRFAIRLERFHLQQRGITREFIQNKKKEISAPGILDAWQCDFTLSLLVDCKGTKSFDVTDVPRWLPKRLNRGHAHIPHDKLPDISLSCKDQNAICDIQSSNGIWLTPLTNTEISSVSDLLAQSNKNKLITCLGFHLLTHPEDKAGSLRGYPHAFCEPILGLVECKEAVSLTEYNNLFWEYQWGQSGPLLTNWEATNETA